MKKGKKREEENKHGHPQARLLKKQLLVRAQLVVNGAYR